MEGAKRAEKLKAMEEVVEEAEVVGVDGPSGEARPQKRAKRKGERASRSGSLRWIWRSDASEKPWVPSFTL